MKKGKTYIFRVERDDKMYARRRALFIGVAIHNWSEVTVEALACPGGVVTHSSVAAVNMALISTQSQSPPVVVDLL